MAVNGTTQPPTSPVGLNAALRGLIAPRSGSAPAASPPPTLAAPKPPVADAFVPRMPAPAVIAQVSARDVLFNNKPQQSITQPTRFASAANLATSGAIESSDPDHQSEDGSSEGKQRGGQQG